MEKFFKNLSKAKIAAVTLSAIILCTLLFVFLFKNIFSYSFIQSYLEDFLNLNISFSNPKIVISPNLDINFKANKITVQNNPKTKTYLIIDKTELKFKPLSFIVKKANIKKLNIENVTFYASRDKNGQIDILDDINKKNIDFLINHPLKITKLNAKIDNITFLYDDKFSINNQITFSAKNTQTQISKKSKKFILSSSGNINFKNQKNAKTNFDIKIKSKYPFDKFETKDLENSITIKNINLLLFNDLIKKYISHDIVQYSANADIYLNNQNKKQKFTCIIKNQKFILKNNKTVIPYKEPLKITSLFNFKNQKLEIEEGKIISNFLDVNIKGNITNKGKGKYPDTDTKIVIKNTQLNNFLYYIPDNAIFYRPQGIPKLKESNFFALLNGEINLKLFPIDITGNLKASDVHIPGIKKAYRQNDVNAYFMKDKMRIFTRVYTPDNEYVIIDGISNLDNSLSGKYSVQSTKKIDLEFAQKYLVPIQQIIGFNIGPVPIMKIKGWGNINIKTQGSLSDAQVFGKFSAYQASAKIEGLNADLKKGSCELVFDNRNLIFKNISGKVKEANFLLTGTGNTKGEVDLKVKLTDSNLSTVLDIFNNSVLTKRFDYLTKKIAAVSGKTEAEVNLKGTILNNNYEDVNFLNNLNLSGNIGFKNNKIVLKNKSRINSLFGIFLFGEEQNGKLNAKIGNSDVALNILSKDNIKKIEKTKEVNFASSIYSKKLSTNDVLANILPQKLFKINLNSLSSLSLPDLNFLVNIQSRGKLAIEDNGNLKIKNLNNKGTIKGINSKNNSLVYFKNGEIKLNGARAFFDNFNLIVSEGETKINGFMEFAQDIFNSPPKINSRITFKNIDLKKLNVIIPNVKFNDAKVKSGEIIIHNDSAKFSNINALYDTMPVYLNAEIKDLFTKKIINGDFSTILDENTTDSIINPFLITPVKIKGEIPLKASIKGTSENYLVDVSANIPVESDISYLGANIGDTNIKREITGKIEVSGDTAKINNLRLVKFIANQNNKVNPLTTLKINGILKQQKSDFYYNNFKITTYTPINVRILNLLFKKSLLKKGNFECNLNLNGNVKLPLVLGKINFEDLDIPLYDTKINTIDFNLNKKYIKGLIAANSKNSDINLELLAQNRFKTPYIVENLEISSNHIDMVSILNSLSTQTPKNDISQKQELPIKPQDITIKNGTAHIKNVKYEKITASNLKSNFEFKNNVFLFKDASFDIANGQISANGKYNLNNTKLNLLAAMKNCNAQTLTKEFLNLSDQLYGNINGSIILNGKGLNTPDNIKNITSTIIFSIENGKMPKLGSLEYLLRAGNILKNGVLGLSINNLIQILTPYKTGEFENIAGKLVLSHGTVQNLEIASKGKNMSLYLEGNYDILKTFADIDIYGKLSQNVSSALGTVGNASIKQFIDAFTPNKKTNEKNKELLEKLNKIPTPENETKTSSIANDAKYKFFSAKVLGDINKDNYIKSFKWE